MSFQRHGAAGWVCLVFIVVACDTPTPPAATHRVSVRLVGAGSGSVIGASLDCHAGDGARCEVEVEEGQRVELEARADEGSRIAGWSIDGCDGARCAIDVRADIAIEVTFDRAPASLALLVNGAGAIDVAPLGHRCTGSCSYALTRGDAVTLTPVAEAGARFVAWAGACASATEACALTLDGDVQAEAVFAPVTDALMVIRAGDGMGRVTSAPRGIDCGDDCAEQYPLGTAVRLEAAPDDGSDFAGWSGDCAGPTDCELVVDGGNVAIATFARSLYELRVTRDGDGAGTVTAAGGIDCGETCAATYAHGDTVILTATADDASGFAGWTGACTDAASTCAVTITEATEVRATFTRQTHALTVTRAGGGAGVITGAGIDCGADCEEVFGHGARVSLEAVPEPSSSEFAGWSGACTGMDECVVEMSAARAVEARFELAPRTLTVEVAGGGAATIRSTPAGIECGGDCEETWLHGATVQLSVEVAEGSRFNGWITDDGACTGTGECVIALERDRYVAADVRSFQPTRFDPSATDPEVRVREDGLALDLHNDGGARTNRSVGPGDGVFYFEGERLVSARGPYGVGVSTAALPFTTAFVGDTDQSFGVTADGAMVYESAWSGAFDARNDHYGFVVDYRGASPIVHLIVNDASGAPFLRHTQAMSAVTEPLYIYAAGQKRMPDFQIAINPGNDVANQPFAYDPEAVLRAAGLTAEADALVLGWGDSHAGPPDTPPVLTPSADQVVTAGTPVTVSVSAVDAEEGDVSAHVRWELLSTPHYAGRLRGAGPSFTFTPTEVGLHPARARVTDVYGRTAEAVVMVAVEGPVAQHDPVRLVPDARSGAGIQLAPDGLAARWTGGGKMGVRANQSIYGEFWYFEMHRLIEPVNQGGGLVTGDGNLGPYDWADVPASCSVNTGGGTWWDIIWQANWPAPASTYDTYGFAVDYRGVHPIVYVILGGTVIRELELTDAWTEMHPMIYGNPTDRTVPGEYDEAINFGASAFTYDAAAALAAHGVDTSDFEAGWGDANTAP